MSGKLTWQYNGEEDLQVWEGVISSEEMKDRKCDIHFKDQNLLSVPQLMSRIGVDVNKVRVGDIGIADDFGLFMKLNVGESENIKCSKITAEEYSMYPNIETSEHTSVETTAEYYKDYEKYKQNKQYEKFKPAEYPFYSYKFQSGTVVKVGTIINVEIDEKWEITQINEVQWNGEHLLVNGKAKMHKNN